MTRGIYGSLWLVVLVFMFLFPFGSLSFGQLDLVNANWKDDVNGNGSDPTKWDIGAVPTSSHHVYLPIWDSNLYTVTVDGSWTIGDLDTYWNSTVSLGGNTLTVNNGSYIRGTLDIRGGQFNNDGSGNMSMNATSKILGYGTIGQSLAGDDGNIEAQGGTLSVNFVSNTHNGATLTADGGATLYVGNTHDMTSYGVTDLNGGTLNGYAYYYYNWNLHGTSGNHAIIQGHGTFDHYLIGTDNAYVEINANDTNGTLTLGQGFVGQTYNQALTVSNYGTLQVLQKDYDYWNCDGATTMYGGSITGDQMRQRGTFNVNSGTNTVQNAIFYGSVGTNTISNGATLQASGYVYLDGATIAAGTGGGSFNVLNGGTVEGNGTINPSVTVNGTLKASVSGQTLTVNGTLNNQNTAYATGGGTLNPHNTVTNGGTLYANGGTVTLDSALTNSGNAYATGGSSMTVSGSLTNNSGANAYATGGGTLTLNGSVYNRGSVYANGGTVNVNGAIKAGTSETGDFAATSGTMNVIGTIETGTNNTFTANSGGTINLPGSPNTQNFNNNEALKPRGGTITIGSGQTLTNYSTRTIQGYGTLLSDGRNLTNQGLIEASGGTFDVHGTITNTGTMRAASGYTLNVGSTLSNNTNGAIYAQAGSTVNLNSADLTNNSAIYTTGSGALVTVADAAPQGSGTFSADTGGTIRFANGFTNSGLGANALRLTGGKITAAGGAMTNVQNKAIAGYGSLLDSGLTLNNSGTVAASGGNLFVAGNVSNDSLLWAEGSDALQVSGTLTNSGSGTVHSENGAVITLGTVINDGAIEIVGGGGGGRIGFGSASGVGRYTLDQGQMSFANLMMSPNAFLDDNSVSGSTLSVLGNLGKLQGALNDFNALRLETQVYNPAMIGLTHMVQWDAIDRGAILHGLDDNLVLGHVTLGDGFGLPKTDRFLMTGESFLYCYGLMIQSDAVLDLQGATIYYLRDGVAYNGVTGTGFDLKGGYTNGQIIEIVPEPATLCLLGLGAIALRRYRRRR